MIRRANIVAVAVVLMLSVLLLSGVFAVLTLDRSYRDQLLARYQLPVQHLQVNLERVAHYGIALERARGLSRDVKAAWRALDELSAPLDDAVAGHRAPSLLLVDPRGQVLALEGEEVDTTSEEFLDALMLPNAKGQSAAGTFFVDGRDQLYVPMRITDSREEWVASLIAVIHRSPIDAKLELPRARAMRTIFLTTALGLLFYVLVLAIVFEFYVIRRQKILSPLLWISVVFGVVVMLGTAHTASRPYQSLYHTASEEKAGIFVELMRRDTGKALQRGTSMEFMDFSHYPWRSMLRHTPELGTLLVRDANGQVVMSADRERFVHLVNERLRPMTSTPVALSVDEDDGAYGADVLVDGQRLASVVALMSSASLRGSAMDLIADALAATLVSILIFVELLLLFHYLGSSRAAPEKVSRADHASALMRPATFLFLFGIDLSMSFVPLYTEKLFQPLLGLSRDVVVGLPISAEFLFVGIAMLAAGAWIDRGGWRKPFFAGIGLAGFGAVYSWLAPDIYQFITARAILGAGYGLTLMATQSYVIGRSDSRSTAASLAKLFAGVYGGSICGGVAGAILAEHFGFGPVFLAGGVIILSVFGYAALLLRGEGSVTPASDPTAEPGQATVAGGGAGVLGRFLTNRAMLGLMLFSSLPASIAAVGFLNYFSPIYLSRLGASQSTIGQVLMLYGVCLVFFGPWVSRSMDTIERKKLAVLAGCLLGGAAFLSFQLLDGLIAAAVAVVLLGLSHALVLSSQSAYALALKVSRDLGKGKAISVFRATGRIGQMLGPVAFGTIALAGSVNEGIVYLGYAYLAMAMLFMLCTWQDAKLLVEGDG